jgi:hypothetical protein
MKVLNFDTIHNDGREIEQIGEREIYVVKNFLTEYEQETLYNALESLTREDFYNAYLKNQIKRQAKERFGTDDLDYLIENKIIESLDKEFNLYWSDKIFFIDDINKDIELSITERLRKYLQPGYNFINLRTVQKHSKGQSLDYHYDNAYEKDIKFAVAIYLNDNYEGGDLHFPPESDIQKMEGGTNWELNTDEINGIVIKPVKRNMVIFSTTGDYVHGVLPVLSDDNRYAIVTFIR